MTESEWLVCQNPEPMLEHLRGAASDRKSRLFTCACYRRIAHLLTTADREMIPAIERIAEGTASPSDALMVSLPPESPLAAFDRPLVASTACATLRGEASGESWHPKGMGDCLAAERGEQAAQCRLLREIFPFRPIAIDYRWQTSTVVDIARAIYDDLAFERMPILADALMDAGCDDAAILMHCRQSGEHFLGCWVLDLLLGKQ